MGNYDSTLLALNPDSYWRCNALSGTTLVDAVGGKDLTITGTPAAFNVSTGFVGVGNGINFGNVDDVSYARIGSALTQIASNKFSAGGWFYWTGDYGQAFSTGPFCASYSGGHTAPFYIFYVTATGATQWRIAINTSGGSFAPFDTGVAMPSLGTWHHILLSYNGTTTKLFVDDAAVVNSAFYSGALSNTMGSFAINTIPASTVFKGPLRCSSFAYWHDYAVTQADIDLLWASRLDSGVVTATQALQQLQPIARRFT